MGVRRLMGYCLNANNNCYDTIDLVSVAQQRNGIEILVDYYNFVHLIRRKFVFHLGQETGNGYLCLMGSEYASLDKYICHFLNKLKSAKIILRFYIDGGKGSSADDKRQKMEVWKRRHIEDVDTLCSSLSVCCGEMDIQDFSVDKCIRPVILEIQINAAIKLCGCDIIQIPFGEADAVIAQDFVSRPKTFAVLSNDSDFVVFPNSCVIPDKLFDLDKDLEMVPVQDCSPLNRLICGVLLNVKVLQSLSLSAPEDLIELSIVAGNDYTGPILEHGLWRKLNCRSIEQYADLILRSKRVENIPAVADEMRCDAALTSAIQHSRNFYNLRSVNYPMTNQGHFTKLIGERVGEGTYPPQIMGMHCNMYWHRLILEDTRPGHPCVEIALEPLRRCIYHMILPQHIQSVTEYGRTPFEKLRIFEVTAIDDRNIPRINSILPNKIFNNLRHFHYILTHQEQGSIETIWTDKYGRKSGFKFLLLRYFLLLNWNRNLYVTPDEFLDLVALVYGGYEKESEYQFINICPSPRCVTLGNWLQCIYRVIYQFLGKLLFLSEEFPTPKEMFSGSVWTVYYTASVKDECQKLRNNYASVLYAARQHKNTIIKEKRHVIQHICEGCFAFDGRSRW